MKWAQTSNVELRPSGSVPLSGLSLKEQADGLKIFKMLDKNGKGMVDVRALMGSVVRSDSVEMTDLTEWLNYLAAKKKSSGSEKFGKFLNYIMAKSEEV